MIAQALQHEHGAIVTPVLTISPRADLAVARTALQQADLIYLGGGDVSLLVRTLRERELEELLRQRLAEGATIVGVSAGAVAAGAWWIEYPDPLPDPPLPFDGGTLLEGLGLGDFVIDAHAEEDHWEELHHCLGLLAHDRPERCFMGYGIPRGGALIVEPDGRVVIEGKAPLRLPGNEQRRPDVM